MPGTRPGMTSQILTDPPGQPQHKDQYFRDGLDPRIGIGLGVIDVKVNTVETPEQVARRIEQAVNISGDNRIRWVHPDCGFWMNKRSVADRKMEALVKGRDLLLGR